MIIVLIPLMLQIYRNCCCFEQLLILHWHEDPGRLRANGSGPLATRKRDEFIGALCAGMRMMRINGCRSKLGTSWYLNNSMVNLEQYWTYGLYSRLPAISLNGHTKIHAMFTKCTCQMECWTSHQLLFVESLELSDHNGSHIETQHMTILRFAMMESCDRLRIWSCRYGRCQLCGAVTTSQRVSRGHSLQWHRHVGIRTYNGGHAECQAVPSGAFSTPKRVVWKWGKHLRWEHGMVPRPI